MFKKLSQVHSNSPALQAFGCVLSKMEHGLFPPAQSQRGSSVASGALTLLRLRALVSALMVLATSPSSKISVDVSDCPHLSVCLSPYFLYWFTSPPIVYIPPHSCQYLLSFVFLIIKHSNRYEAISNHFVFPFRFIKIRLTYNLV